VQITGGRLMDLPFFIFDKQRKNNHLPGLTFLN